MNIRSICDDIKPHMRQLRLKLDDLARVVQLEEDRRTLREAEAHLGSIDDVVKRAMDDYKAQEAVQ